MKTTPKFSSYLNPSSTSHPPLKPPTPPPTMVDPTFFRLINLRSPPSTTAHGGLRLCISAIHALHSHYTTSTTKEPKHYNNNKNNGKWYTLPPFTPTLNAAALGKELSARSSQSKADVSTTALKWVLKCCPDLPRSLVQKLFRLRQVLLYPYIFFLSLNYLFMFVCLAYKPSSS